MSLGEDAFFNLEYLSATGFDFLIVNETLYHYIKRDNESLDQKYRPDYFEVQVRIFGKFLKYCRSIHADNKAMNKLYLYYFNALMVAMDNLYGNKDKIQKKDFEFSMAALKNKPQYMELINRMGGFEKFLCMGRYVLMRIGGFGIDYKIREIIKRKIGEK